MKQSPKGVINKQTNNDPKGLNAPQGGKHIYNYYSRAATVYYL